MRVRAGGARVVLVALCLMLALASCKAQRPAAVPSAAPSPTSSSSPATSWNVILISMNNVSLEHMSLYGYKRQTTPRLDRLAKDALVFDAVYAPCSWTLPGATSLMTSVQPYSHGVEDRKEGNFLHPDLTTLGEVFKRNGYATAAFTGGLDYRPTFGHMRGIDDASFNLDFTPFSTTLKQAERWLGRNGDRRFFLVLQGYDAHPPYHPPAPFKGTFSGGKRHVKVSTKFTVRGYREGDKYVASYIWEENDPHQLELLDIAYPPEKRTIVLTQDDIDYLCDLYDDCILSVDSQIADFIEKLDPKIRERTVIAVLSEHGEMFARHGRFGRAGSIRGTLYDDVIRAPLVLFVPNGAKGRVGGLGQLIDVAPTLLDLVGLPSPPTFQGKSLLPLVGHPDQVVNVYAFGGSAYNKRQAKAQKHHTNPFFRSQSTAEFVFDHRWKLIHEVLFSDAADDLKSGESWELYDLESDPGEQRNVAAQHGDIVSKLRARLEAWAASARAALVGKEPSKIKFPPDFEEQARRHGYW